jgi:hypothetical protein
MRDAEKREALEWAVTTITSMGLRVVHVDEEEGTLMVSINSSTTQRY